MHWLALLLAAGPPADAKALLEQKLSREVTAGQVDLRSDGDVTAVRILRDDVFEKLDPLWTTLGAAVQASKRGAVRVDAAHLDAKGCDERRLLLERYLFDKQKADRAKLSVRLTCGPRFPEPLAATLGALTLSAPDFLSSSSKPLTGVSFLVTNTSDAGVELSIERLELRVGQSLQKETPPPPWTVPIDGLWFHGTTGGDPSVQVRERGVGPTRFVVPPSRQLEVMLQVEPVTGPVAGRRVSVSTREGRVVFAGPVTKFSFHDGTLQGTPRP